MLFTRLSFALAWLLCFVGVWSVFAGFYFGDDPELMTRYVGSRPPGFYIDRGVLVFLVGILLGTLSEISSSLTRNKTLHLGSR